MRKLGTRRVLGIKKDYKGRKRGEMREGRERKRRGNKDYETEMGEKGGIFK